MKIAALNEIKFTKLHPHTKSKPGNKYGKLTFIDKREGSLNKGFIWQCDCGTLCELPSNYVRYGNTTSCGCFRKSGEACRKHKCPDSLTAQQLSVITGSMLGDGWIDKTLGNHRFKKAQIHYESINWICEILKPFTEKVYEKYTKQKIVNKVNGEKCKPFCIPCEKRLTHYYTRTCNHPIFSELETKWYKRDGNGIYIKDSKGWRIKTIPDDLKLTPEILMMAV